MANFFLYLVFFTSRTIVFVCELETYMIFGCFSFLDNLPLRNTWRSKLIASLRNLMIQSFLVYFINLYLIEVGDVEDLERHFYFEPSFEKVLTWHTTVYLIKLRRPSSISLISTSSLFPSVPFALKFLKIRY